MKWKALNSFHKVDHVKKIVEFTDLSKPKPKALNVKTTQILSSYADIKKHRAQKHAKPILDKLE